MDGLDRKVVGRVQLCAEHRDEQLSLAHSRRVCWPARLHVDDLQRPRGRVWGGNGIPNPHGRFATGAPERLLLNAVMSEGNVGADAHGRRPNWA